MANPFSVLGPEFYGFLLPWIFTFAVVYGLIKRANTFGNETAKVSVAVAFVAAFFVTAAGGPALAGYFITLFGGASVFIAGILVVILFLAMVDKHSALNSTYVVGALVVIGVFLFLSSSGTVLGINIDSQMATLIFWGIILIAVAWFMTSSAGAPAPAAPAAGGAGRT